MAGSAPAAPLAAPPCSPPSLAPVVSPPVVASEASACVMTPPAPYSTILTAHSLHATKCLHGRSTTSRGEERHKRHSEDGSTSAGGAAGAAGGYACVTDAACDGAAGAAVPAARLVEWEDKP